MRKLKKENGITLVALVVIIIILLILAGISVSMLTGENGLITKAQQAKYETELGEIKEEVSLKWMEVQADTLGSASEEEIESRLKEKLQQEDPEATVHYNDENLTYEIDYKDTMLEIQPDGTITTNRKDLFDLIKEILDSLDPNLNGEDKANAIDKELKKEKPDSKTTYDDSTGKITVDVDGYIITIDENNELSIVSKERPRISITKEPEDVGIIGEGTATFSVETKIKGDEKYQWYQSTTNSTTGGTEIPGATGASYTTVTLNTESTNKYYYCKITATLQGQTVDETTKVAKVDIVKKVSLDATQVTKTEVQTIEGESATFEVIADGEGELIYQWYKNTTNSNTGGVLIDGAINSTYTMENAKLEDNNSYYYCVITQKFGGQEKSIQTNTIKLSVEEKVKITKQPTEQKQLEGGTATFGIETQGGENVTYQWYKNTKNSNNGGTLIEGATNKTYNIENINASMNQSYYYCVATQSYGEVQVTVTSNAAQLLIAGKVTITKQPTMQNKLEGNTATFSIETSSNIEGELSYQWYVNETNSNENGTKIIDATNNEYITEILTKEVDGRYYYCEITQKYGDNTYKVNSATALLTVGAKASITKQPEAQTGLVGNQAIFNVQVEGNGNINYQWYSNISNSTEGGTALAGAISNEYRIDETTTAMSGTYYYCVITQEYEGQSYVITTETARLTVIERVAITKQPTAVSVLEGKVPVTFAIETSGNGDLTYKWYSNTSSNTENGILIGGATDKTYTISENEVTTELNGKYYYCKVIQDVNGQTAEVTSIPALLTVAPEVSITKEADDVTVTAGNTATFEIETNGAGNLSYQWYENTTNSTTGGTEIPDAIEKSYTIESATSDLSGKYYYCVVTQQFGNPVSKTVTKTSTPAMLTVGENVSVGNPENVTAIAGKKEVSFEVTATGAGSDAFTYQWYKNTTDSNEGGEEIGGAINKKYTIIKENVQTNLNNTYYYCTVTQNYGSSTKTATSNPAKLEVGEAVAVQTQPEAQTVYESREASFSTAATGGGTISYQWYENTTNSNEGGTEITEETNPEYTIAEATTDKNRKYYYCKISQRFGTETAEVTTNAVQLTVTATEITASETDVIVYKGGASRTLTLGGNNHGAFTIEEGENTAIATTTIEGEALTIEPIATGQINLLIKEGNGNKTKAIKIVVKETAITASNTNVIAYVGGTDQTVTLEGTNAGALSIETAPTSTIATATINNNIITIHPVKAGTTKVVAKEGNGNKTVEINIEVKATTIEASSTNVTLQIGSETATQNITLSGADAGAFSITTNADTAIATTSLSGSTLTITGVKEGTTKVVIKEGNGNKTVEIGITVEDPNISKTESYVGYYADVDANGTVDGVIYADLAVGGTGTWGKSDGTYTVPTETGTKNYYVSQKNYSGKFGTKDVLTATGSGKDRFYVMALTDIDGKQNGTGYSWYYSAFNKISSITSDLFGGGRKNTEIMVGKWNASAFGPQNGNPHFPDLWGVGGTRFSGGWFVPSRGEWAAFGDAFNITGWTRAFSLGLSTGYWSSSLNPSHSNYMFYSSYKPSAGMVRFNWEGGTMYARLSTTF